MLTLGRSELAGGHAEHPRVPRGYARGIRVGVPMRKRQTNIECDPPDYPTANYTAERLDTYSSTLFGFAAGFMF